MTAIIPGGLSEALMFLVPWVAAAIVYVIARAVCNAATAGYATVAHWLDGRRAAARRTERLEVVAYLRRRADDYRGNPSDAARRSALGQAANELDRGLAGEFDRAVDRAYRDGLAAGQRPAPGHVAASETERVYGGVR